MTDEQIWNLVVNVGSIAMTVIGSVAVAAWWLKSQLTGGEIAGLKAENKSLRAEVGNVTARCEVLDQRRLLAEDQRKKTADDLLEVRAKLETAMVQVGQHVSTEALSETIRVAATSANAALSANNQLRDLLSTKAVGPDIIVTDSEGREIRRVPIEVTVTSHPKQP